MLIDYDRWELFFEMTTFYMFLIEPFSEAEYILKRYLKSNLGLRCSFLNDVDQSTLTA